jgi:hypothetical protein
MAKDLDAAEVSVNTTVQGRFPVSRLGESSLGYLFSMTAAARI